MLLAIGIMMSAAEVPRIAQQFGLDTSVKVNAYRQPKRNIDFRRRV